MQISMQFSRFPTLTFNLFRKRGTPPFWLFFRLWCTDKKTKKEKNRVGFGWSKFFSFFFDASPLVPPNVVLVLTLLVKEQKEEERKTLWKKKKVARYRWRPTRKSGLVAGAGDRIMGAGAMIMGARSVFRNFLSAGDVVAVVHPVQVRVYTRDISSISVLGRNKPEGVQPV